MGEKNTRIFRCDCGTELLLIEDLEDGEYCLSMWKRQKGQIRWMHRLSHIWDIIRYGEPYHDNFCFDREKAAELAKIFTEFATAPSGQGGRDE
jgi:hypothetical protein